MGGRKVTVRIEHDPTVDALYLRLRTGHVAETVELSDSIYLDIDPEGQILGAEFVNAGDFFAILQRHGGHLDIPDHVDQLASVP
jgi:uncharacterized protein YuzE